MRLKIFSQTITDKAISWYKSHPKGTFDSWDKLSVVFLLYFYPEGKSNGARRMIINFLNRAGESLLNGYGRFRELVDYFPHHELPPWLVLHIFYGGLCSENREVLDLVSGGVFMKYTTDVAWELLNDMLMNK